jgi:C1A family cysteine protease
MPTPSHPYAFGWLRDLPDHNDAHFRMPPLLSAAALPRAVDLRPLCPPVYDQGQLGSCVANATAGAVQMVNIREGTPNYPEPSRLFVYYETRKIEGTIASDAGSMPRDAMKVVSKVGVVSEALWPYDTARFATQPGPPAIYKQAERHRVTKYLKVDGSNLSAVRACVAARNPIVFGFAIYESFVTDRVRSSGVMPMPLPGEALLGGHSVVIVGYDMARQAALCRNSWGPSWGLGGYFWMPFFYLTDFQQCSDFWTIQVAS